MYIVVKFLMTSHWLVKAEPLSRLVKGIDVAFSVDRFEKEKVCSCEGVRNYQARKYLRDQMKTGHRVLFYHSSCKVPGIVALASVCKDGYPDNTAWEPGNPYFDPRSDPKAPQWYMVDLQFEGRLTHPVPLGVLKHLTSSDLSDAQREDVKYLSEDHLLAVANMLLLNRSRLSVQVRKKSVV